ncbi:IclR family transcriptional regulator domain-containing protein [Halopelagius fulvigenes]|uniref:IclR family transcriptional regulator C-terminal domain-containing protein n=1 Tax=Halopelagius fulvigenes TaxID=1198324 RepID=A0ABD5TSW0_9EURY
MGFIADGWAPAYREGERMPLHLNAPGKSLLASLPDDRLTEILGESDLTARTEATLTDRDELEAELRRIRDNGFSFCRGEQFEGHRRSRRGVFRTRAATEWPQSASADRPPG